MKKIAAKVVFLMTFVFALAAAGYSQTILKADVPFDFTVGKKTFPAGEYDVVRITSQTLGLRGSDRRFLTTFVTEQVTSPMSYSTPKLKFEAVGGQYVLSGIDSANAGYELFVKKPLNIIAQTPSSPEGQTATSTNVGK